MKNLLLAIGIFGLLLVNLSACTKESAETQISKMLTDSVEYANSSDLGELMNNISENFSGPQGMGKKDAKRYIFAKLYKKDWQRVFIYESQIQIQSPDLAGVTLKIVLARGDNIERLEDLKTKTSYDAFQLSLVVKNEESSWRVSSAKHKRMQANEVF